MQGVEKGLSEQIGYLTQVATGQPHEGSTYGAEKVLNWVDSILPYFLSVWLFMGI